MNEIVWPRRWLEARGFQRAEGGQCWRRPGLRLGARDGWLILEKECGGTGADPLRDLSGHPGLWKYLGAERNLQVFELPLSVLFAAGAEGRGAAGQDAGDAAGQDAGEAASQDAGQVAGQDAGGAIDGLLEAESPEPECACAAALQAAVTWALDTCKDGPADRADLRERNIPAREIPAHHCTLTPGEADRRTLSRDELDALVPPGALTVQSGGIVLQGSLHRDAGRLALSIPLCSSMLEPLSPARRHWFRELLLDGQDRWRMVRVCWEEDADFSPAAVPGAGLSVPWAEVDLTGAPALLLDSLIPAALAALRWVVVWMAHSADFLADGACPCRALEACFTGD